MQTHVTPKQRAVAGASAALRVALIGFLMAFPTIAIVTHVFRRP